MLFYLILLYSNIIYFRAFSIKKWHIFGIEFFIIKYHLKHKRIISSNKLFFSFHTILDIYILYLLRGEKMNKNKIKLCTLLILNDVPEPFVVIILNQIDVNDEFAMEIENALLEFSRIDNFA